jgi:hypothetical protein
MSPRSPHERSFVWGDSSAKPGHDYTYRLVAIRGRVKHLKQAEDVWGTVCTEDEDAGAHAIYFVVGCSGSKGPYTWRARLPWTCSWIGPPTRQLAA